jgi:hypothetical protein
MLTLPSIDPLPHLPRQPDGGHGMGAGAATPRPLAGCFGGRLHPTWSSPSAPPGPGLARRRPALARAVLDKDPPHDVHRSIAMPAGRLNALRPKKIRADQAALTALSPRPASVSQSRSSRNW